METTRKDTLEILELKNTLPEIKSTLDRLNSLMNAAERDSSESTDKCKLSKIMIEEIKDQRN